MEILYARCAGLDVHKDTVVACARVVAEGHVQQVVKTFETTTRGLLALLEWLQQYGCTHVAMEATGVYWKPVWHILEGSVHLVLANAMHIRNVPGRKTDVNDAMWIADLLAHGLIRGSFVPEASIQALRLLTRTRKQLVRERVQHRHRSQKILEDANLKLASIVSDLLGRSGRAILHALAAGETDPEALAALAQGRLKARRTPLLEALRGRITKAHQFLLQVHLDQIEALDRAIEATEAEVDEFLVPFRTAAALLTTIPGVSDTVAHVVIAEIGVDMARFPTAGHLLSWAGLCPRNDERAGKRRSTRVRTGAPWLKTTLVQATWAATRVKGTYLRAQFLRLRSRRGPGKAIIAVAASMLTAIYAILRDRVPYHDLGPDHFDRCEKTRTINRLVRKLKELGCEVELKSAA